MSKKNIVIVIVSVLVVIVLGLFLRKMNSANVLSVVYLTTGEVYVGKLITFPNFQLKDGYILQIAKDATDPTKSNFQLNPVSEALWAPQVIHLNRKNIVFYGPLLPTSKIAESLAAQK